MHQEAEVHNKYRMKASHLQVSCSVFAMQSVGSVTCSPLGTGPRSLRLRSTGLSARRCASLLPARAAGPSDVFVLDLDGVLVNTKVYRRQTTAPFQIHCAWLVFHDAFHKQRVLVEHCQVPGGSGT